PIISFVSYFSFWTFDISVVAILWDHLIFSLWLCLALLIFCIFRSISLLIPLDEFLVSLLPLLSIPIYFSTITKFIFPVDL
ncbi:unnamed protein product, partial [Brassica napus]